MKIRIGLFGRVSASCEGIEFSAFPTRKSAELLMILAVHPDHPISRKELVGLLWPGSSGSKANNRLSATLYILRKTLEESFDDSGAGVVASGEGSIWLTLNCISEFGEASELWKQFAGAVDPDTKLLVAQRFCELYKGHLGMELSGKWYEPLQSLWASRWTECMLWLMRENHVTTDQALAQLTFIQPILPVTRALVSKHLYDIGRSDLALSWQSDIHGSRRVLNQEIMNYRTFSTDDMPTLARRPTMTALVVEASAVLLLRQLVDQAGPLSEWLGSPQIFCARNPLFARRIATRIRQEIPLAKIFLSTEVADMGMRDEARMLEWLNVIEPGETLINSATAMLIQQHDPNVVMEKKMGHSQYRLH
jgi:hypothetical protein